MRFLTIFSILVLSLFISIQVLPALVNHQSDRDLSHVEVEVHKTVTDDHLENEVRDDNVRYDEDQHIYHQDPYIHEHDTDLHEDTSRLPQQDNTRLDQDDILPDEDELRIHQEDSRVYDSESNVYERGRNFRGTNDYGRELHLYEEDYNKGSMEDKIQNRRHFQRENLEDR